MKRVLTEPQGRLLRPLIALLTPSAAPIDRQFPLVVVESFHSDDWSSLTFDGHRHWLTLIVHGATIDALPSLDSLCVTSAIVAEARIVAVEPVARGVVVTVAVMTVTSAR